MSLFSKKADGREGSAAPAAVKGGYGIAEATQLMRALPVDQNVELVVRVIRSTLESMNVQLGSIVEDAEAKERGLCERMATLKGEMTELSREIERRRQEILALETELDETTTVKGRLLLAQKLGGPATSSSSTALAPTPPPLPAGMNGKAKVAAAVV
jgi:hypothetical protein